MTMKHEEEENNANDSTLFQRSTQKLLIVSSHNFSEKVPLPPRTKYLVERKDVYLAAVLEVRRHNGLCWNMFRSKTCVLLNSGRLLIYSDMEHGVSIKLSELRALKHSYTEKGIHVIRARCAFELVRGKERLGILVKGDRCTVTEWRRGMACAHQDVDLGHRSDTNHELWASASVDASMDEALLVSIAERSLRWNTSMPSLKLFSQMSGRGTNDFRSVRTKPASRKMLLTGRNSQSFSALEKSETQEDGNTFRHLMESDDDQLSMRMDSCQEEKESSGIADEVVDVVQEVVTSSDKKCFNTPVMQNSSQNSKYASQESVVALGAITSDAMIDETVDNTEVLQNHEPTASPYWRCRSAVPELAMLECSILRLDRIFDKYTMDD